jgi:hypothetical protein
LACPPTQSHRIRTKTWERKQERWTDLGGGGDGREDPGADEVGEEAGEAEKEDVVQRHEQRRGPVAPLLGRLLFSSCAELLGRVHFSLALGLRRIGAEKIGEKAARCGS